MGHLPHIFDYTPEAMRSFVGALGMPSYVADQLLDWVYQKGVIEVATMSNISARNRDAISSHLTFYAGNVVRHQLATDQTQKLLIDWSLCEPGER